MYEGFLNLGGGWFFCYLGTQRQLNGMDSSEVIAIKWEHSIPRMNKGDTDVFIHKFLYVLVLNKQMTWEERCLGNHTETEDSYGNGKKELLNVLKTPPTNNV